MADNAFTGCKFPIKYSLFLSRVSSKQILEKSRFSATKLSKKLHIGKKKESHENVTSVINENFHQLGDL